ncbi:MAG: hypothetical protein Q8P27_00420 [Candidatus Peregrinibacteria bacterium]|nr:hypothetical protein [Candidatus Peregrinibacteria bacterium]
MANLSKGAMVGLVGAVATLVSVFGNWYNYDLLGFEIQLKPWDVSTGKLLLVVAILAALFIWMGNAKSKKGMYVLSLLMGLIVLLVVFANYPSSDLLEGVTIGWGYWLSLIGGVLVTVGGLMGMTGIKKG